MKSNLSIQIKAAILLLVFAMNTLIGFACAVGVDMGFNMPHHQDEEITKVHVHSDGTNHDHHKKPDQHQHKESKAESKENKGCCNDEAQKLQSLDKVLNQHAKTLIDTPVFVAIISTFLYIDIFNSVKAYPSKYITRHFHPPPSDIRIIIQSFQI